MKYRIFMKLLMLVVAGIIALSVYRLDVLAALVNTVPLIVLWFNVCSEKALETRRALRHFFYEEMMSSSEFDLVYDLFGGTSEPSLILHTFYLMTFRNPLKLYILNKRED